MQLEVAISKLEREWNEPSGFFFLLRQGTFDEELFRRAHHVLESCELSDDEPNIARRFVALAWYVPCFMEWQCQRVEKSGGDTGALEKAIAAMRNEIERILGVP